MPKQTTLHIQNILKELGKKLGFISVMEESMHEKNMYAPIYDVVWYLDITNHFNVDALKPLFANSPELLERIKMLPVAGFEIEGASTSSKNQLGNFANLYSGRFLYNFVIVNNNAANGEDDTYRRGKKIYKYFQEEFGSKNTIFMDYVHLENSLQKPISFDKSISSSVNGLSTRKTCGGDMTSINMYNTIFPMLAESQLEILQNYSPIMPKIKFSLEINSLADTVNPIANFKTGVYFKKIPDDKDYKIAKKATDMYYIPKLDTVLGFTLPQGFYNWLSFVAEVLGEESSSFPILYGIKEKIVKNLFVPLIGIEFENSINKHCNGGIINMAHYSYCGILVGNESADNHIRFLNKNMSINNVTYYVVEESI